MFNMKVKNYDNPIVAYQCCGCEIHQPTKRMCIACKARAKLKEENNEQK